VIYVRHAKNVVSLSALIPKNKCVIFFLEIGRVDIRHGLRIPSVSQGRKALLKPRFHGRANPSYSSVEQLTASRKSAYSSPAGKLHVMFKNGKRRAALWICKTMETQLKQLILPKSV
jgi:hypothetical protein